MESREQGRLCGLRVPPSTLRASDSITDENHAYSHDPGRGPGAVHGTERGLGQMLLIVIELRDVLRYPGFLFVYGRKAFI